MFKLKSIEVNGFWQTKKASAQFRDDVNIIIGKNGTGKTTFMNIAHAVLTVDTEALYENNFKSVTLILSDGKRTRTIRADRKESKNLSFPIIEYHISNRRFVALLIGNEDGRTMGLSIKRRAAEESTKIKIELNKIVAVASLSVYRIGGETDPELRERMPRRLASTVDLRLLSLMQKLTQYQLELSNEARDISTQLQRDVLTSLLYTKEKGLNQGYNLDFDEATERRNLISAYQQLGVSGSEVAKKIQEHISAVGKTIKDLRFGSGSNSSKKQNPSTSTPVDVAALEAFKLTSAVIEKSLAAEEKIKSIFSQPESFKLILKEFIPDKSFAFSGGELVVKTEGDIPMVKLSSGEKQLLILFIEALLQRRKPYIFLADEPELSLHILWQRNIISAIRDLNPNAQIVVATHSPEIAGKFRAALMDMESILHG